MRSPRHARKSAASSATGTRRSEPVDARPALPGALIRQPARHPRGLGHRAGAVGQHEHDPGPQPGAQRRELPGRQPDRSGVGGADPSAATATQQKRAGRLAAAARVGEQHVECQAVLDLIDPGGGDRAADSHQCRPGSFSVPTRLDQPAPWRAISATCAAVLTLDTTVGRHPIARSVTRGDPNPRLRDALLAPLHNRCLLATEVNASGSTRPVR